MSESLTIEKNPRIASYTVPAETWTLSILLIVLALVDRFVGTDQMHNIVDVALIAVFAISALDFVVPFLRPNSILGGARLKSAALAGAALLAWLA
jgi:hypothetical protein